MHKFPIPFGIKPRPLRLTAPPPINTPSVTYPVAQIEQWFSKLCSLQRHSYSMKTLQTDAPSCFLVPLLCVVRVTLLLPFFYRWEFHPTGHLYHFQCLKPLMQKCAALAERRPTSCVFSGEAGTEMQSHSTVDSMGADLIRTAKRCGPLSWHLGFINKCVSTSAHTHLIRHPVGEVHPYLSVHKCNVYHKSTMLSKWTKPDQIQVICTCSQEHSKTIAQLF